jgi:hypothetical protein
MNGNTNTGGSTLSVCGILEINNGLTGPCIEDDNLSRRALDGQLALVWRESGIGGDGRTIFDLRARSPIDTSAKNVVRSRPSAEILTA